MVKRWSLVGGILLLVSLLLTGCVPKADYEAVVAERASTLAVLQSVKSQLQSVSKERDAAQAELLSVQNKLGAAKSELESVQSELNTAKSELDTAKSELQSKGSVLAQVASLQTSLAKKLALARQVLAFESARYRAYRANKEGKEEEKKEMELLGLSILKSYDALVKELADSELSEYWGAAWPAGAREQSEKQQQPVYSYKDYAKFYDRLSALVARDMDDLQALLAE